MKKLNITKRDIKVFILGLVSMLVIESICDWKSTKKAFIDGWNSVNKEQTK